MAKLKCSIVDADTNRPVDAKVHVLSSQGAFVSPPEAILKVGAGPRFFYAHDGFEVDLPIGQADVVVERGTEYAPLRTTVDIPTEGIISVDLELSRWTNLPDQGWYPGNTHIHYDENERRPDERLRFDSVVEDYSVMVISVLTRRDLAYATNTYPIGLFTDLSTAHHVTDVGEESRHNEVSWKIGYGHVMFINIRNLVDPVSRGTLVSDLDPDYPPLCWACDDAREQGGVVIWCHNGQGMEAPVAAALGKLDAFNLFDPMWIDPEYRLYYHLLNSGIRLPASTGTDWFVCSSNRVYVGSSADFSYDSWLAGLKRGSTFITNGPALFLDVGGSPVGSVVEVASGAISAECTVRWESHYPVDLVELVINGRVAASANSVDRERAGMWETAVQISHDSWIAARLWGRARNSFDHAIYAHTSPVYVDVGRSDPTRSESSRFFVESIDRSLDWVMSSGRYTTDRQRDEISELFLEGRARYAERV